MKVREMIGELLWAPLGGEFNPLLVPLIQAEIKRLSKSYEPVKAVKLTPTQPKATAKNSKRKPYTRRVPLEVALEKRKRTMAANKLRKQAQMAILKHAGEPNRPNHEKTPPPVKKAWCPS